MTGLAAPLLKRGMVHRIEQSLLRRAMGIMATQTGCAFGFHALMNIPKTSGLVIMAGKAELRSIHLQKGLRSPTMGGMAKPTILKGRGMGHPILPVLLDILMAGQTEFRFLFHQQFRFPGTMGDMTNTAVHGSHRRVHKCTRLNQFGDILMTGEANLPFRLAQNKRIIAGMGNMTGLALTLHKGRVPMLLFLLRGRIFVTAQTEFTVVSGCC